MLPNISASRAASRPTCNGADEVPIDFDPADHPIIARHVFGVSPFRPIGEAAARVAADLKRQHQVARLHALDRKLDSYAELEPEARQ